MNSRSAASVDLLRSSADSGSFLSSRHPDSSRLSRAARFVVAAILIASSTAKAYSLLAPFRAPDLADLALIQFEAVLAVLMIFGLATRLTRLGGMAFFACAAAYSATKVWNGDGSCGCFGALPVRPELALAVDWAAIALLTLTRAHDVITPASTGTARRIAAALAGIAALAAPPALAFATRPAMLAPNGAILGGGRAVAAVPSDWLGRPLPLLPFIDIAEQLDNGDWEVILHRRGCENCERAIARATQVRMAGPAGGPRLALIELPPYADGGGSSSAQLAVASRGKLSSDRVWAIETPLELGLRKGIVTNVVGASSVRAPSRQPLGGRTPTPIQSTDCGPACLYVVCAKLGKPEALDALRSMCATDATGTTMLALKQAALRLGYDARAFNGDFDILRCALEPAGIAVILHVRGSHFVVATLTRDGERGAVLVTDPAAGVFQGDEPFLRDDLRWTGDMLVIRKSEDAG